MELSEETIKLVSAANKEFGKASLALVRAASGLVLALEFERNNAAGIPARYRPKITDIKDAIRVEFGADNKVINRQAYDLASLAFRVHAKLSPVETQALLAEGVKRGVTWFEDQISTFAGGKNVDAWRRWVMGETKDPKTSTPFERLAKFIENNRNDLSVEQLGKIAAQIEALTMAKLQTAAMIEEKNQELAAQAA